MVSYIFDWHDPMQVDVGLQPQFPRGFGPLVAGNEISQLRHMS